MTHNIPPPAQRETLLTALRTTLLEMRLFAVLIENDVRRHPGHPGSHSIPELKRPIHRAQHIYEELLAIHRAALADESAASNRESREIH